jgi:hypothetical protein
MISPQTSLPAWQGLKDTKISQRANLLKTFAL